MKAFFPGHFPKDDSVHKALWANCLFVFDTNILLNMYRYSDETRNDFLRTLEQLKDRIWIPYRVAEEYLANRLKVISEQQEEYSSAINEITSLSKKLDNPRQHPFVSKKTMTAVEDSLSDLIKELEENRDIHGKRMHDDEIMSLFATIFEGKVGRELEKEELEEIIKVGETRYSEKIPPGYSDAKKSSGEELLTAKCRPYGDLIVWRQILEKSRKSKAPVIFVTDDGKEDWWLRFKGKTIGPRPELIKEFKAQTELDFHMYHPERFLSLASELLEQKTSDEVLQEIRDVRQKESYETPTKILNYEATQVINHLDSILQQQSALRAELTYFRSHANSLQETISKSRSMREISRRAGIEFVNRYTGHDIESTEQYLNLKTDYEEHDAKSIASQEELNSVLKTMKELEQRIDDLTHRADALNETLASYYTFKNNFNDDQFKKTNY